MPKVMEIDQVDIGLILRSFELEQGQRLYVQVFSKSEAGMRMRDLLKAKVKLSHLYPDECASIRIRHTKISGSFYVFLEQTGKGPMLAYERTLTGKFKPIEMTPEAQQVRRIKLMVQDGYSREQIIEMEGKAAENYFEN
jgi:hypothetical protein